MANWWQVRRLNRGVEGWNKWRENHPDVHSDLNNIILFMADLRAANLDGAYLSNAKLVKTNLSGATFGWAFMFNADLRESNLNKANLCLAQLNEADLRGADLSEADLRGTSLNGADLRLTNLRGADLGKADLREANLSGANLHDTNLQGTLFGSTTLTEVDFRTTKGLAEAKYFSPSAVHLPTLQLPQDGSALHFLRGVGLTDEQIDAWRTKAMLPIQYHSVFISYSSKDEILAHRLYADLQNHGVRCWFAPEDMKIGSKIRDRIDQAIQMQDRSLLLLSEHSIASTWVENEVEAVLEKEAHQKREILFPVRVDEVVMRTSKAWAATLRRTRHIGDFTHWADPQVYQLAFERLLRDLKKADGQEREDGGH